MNEAPEPSGNHLISVKLLLVAAAFGIASLAFILTGFHLPVPGTTVVADPGELFLLLGAALTGPIGGIVVGVLSGIGEPNSGARLFMVAVHVLGGLWVGWAYKRLVHDRIRMPVMLLGWVGVVFVDYFGIIIPVVAAVKLLAPEYLLQVVPIQHSFLGILMFFYRGFLAPFIVSALLSSGILLVLTRRARSPMWWTRRHPRIVPGFHIRPPRNIIALRLTVWVLLLSVIPLLIMGIYLQKALTHLYVQKAAGDALAVLNVLVSTTKSDRELVGLAESAALSPEALKGGKFILDGEGRIVWHRDSTLLFADARGVIGKTLVEEIAQRTSGFFYDRERNSCFLYSRMRDEPRWLVLVMDVDLSPVSLRQFGRESLVRLGLAMAMVAVIAGVVIWQIVGRPIRALAGAARRVGHNDLEARVDPSLMSDEVAVLGEAFNEMTENLAILHKGLQTEIEDRRATETALRESERRFREMADLLPLTVYEVDLDGRFTFTNRATSEMFHFGPGGRPEQYLIADYMIPEDRARAQETMRNVRETGHGSGNEYTFLRVDGSTFPGIVYSSAVRDGARIVGMRGVVVDISDQKQAQEALQNSVAEKEVMLQEIHHRVKNNLQIVSSLLSLQAASIVDPAHLALFQESVDRIRSMALIHDRLYKSRDLVGIEFREYIESLVISLLHSYGRPGVEYRADVQDVRFAIDTAIPFGLIINELVTNALKHAFPDGRSGTITVSLAARPTGEVVLSVADDGIGLPPGLDPANTATLGLQLVKILTDQLAGSLEIQTGKGTTFSILLPPLPVRDGTIGAPKRTAGQKGNSA